MHIVRTPLGLLTFLSYIPALLKRRGELRLFLVQRPSHQWVLRSFFRLAGSLTPRPRLPCHGFHVREILELYLACQGQDWT